MNRCRGGETLWWQMINSCPVATVAWRVEMQGATRSTSHQCGPLVVSNTTPHFAPCIIPVGRPAGTTNQARQSAGIIAIGASTGGTEAIREVLTHFPVNSPPVLIAQHMPAGFTQSFAQRLNDLCKIRVSEARDQTEALPGHAYIAPGHSHLLLTRMGTKYILRLSQTEPVNRHRPSVDVLFDSVAREAGANAIGLILTGMGKDGAKGLLAMKQAGAYTLAQNEASCVVFGMPREAIALQAVDEVVPLNRMAERVCRLFGNGF